MKIEIKVNRYRAADGTDYKFGDIAEVGIEEGAAAIEAKVGVVPGGSGPSPAVTFVPEPKPVEPVSKRERPPGKSSREE